MTSDQKLCAFCFQNINGNTLLCSTCEIHFNHDELKNVTHNAFYCLRCDDYNESEVQECSVCKSICLTRNEIREIFFKTHPRNRPEPHKFYYCDTCNVNNAGTEEVCSTCGIDVIGDRKPDAQLSEIGLLKIEINNKVMLWSVFKNNNKKLGIHNLNTSNNQVL